MKISLFVELFQADHMHWPNQPFDRWSLVHACISCLGMSFDLLPLCNLGDFVNRRGIVVIERLYGIDKCHEYVWLLTCRGKMGSVVFLSLKSVRNISLGCYLELDIIQCQSFIKVLLSAWMTIIEFYKPLCIPQYIFLWETFYIMSYT